MRRAACALMLLLAACGPGRKALIPVGLPDISTVSQPTARAQLRDAYASLDAKIKNPDTPPADLAGGFGEMGRLLMAAEFVVASEPFFRNAETLAPDDRRWPYYLGHVYRTRGDTSSSAAAFERARALAPSDEAALVWLGDAYLNQGRLAEAKDVLNNALAGNPRCVAALYRLGRIALAEHDDRRAVDAFERALAIDPRATILQYPLATAYQRMGDTAQADAHVKLRGDFDVGPVDPLMQQLGELLDTAAVFERRAIDASKANDWKSAALYLRKAVALEPDDASLRHKLGTALSLSGDPQAAIDQLQAALRMAPADVDARYNLAQLLLASGRASEAVAEFERVVHDAPNDADARAGLADARARAR
jgi:tetratricopeptide (TPR) repeat protein